MRKRRVHISSWHTDTLGVQVRRGAGTLRGRQPRLQLPFTILAVGLLITILTGCGQREQYTLSPRVQELWVRHPAPWDSASARSAAQEARELLKRHPRDFQLARYYMDRMEQLDPNAVAVEFSEWRLKYPNDARWMVLDALAGATRGELYDRTAEALEKAPDDPYVMLAHARSILGKRPVMLEHATDLAFSAVSRAPDLPEANGLLAYILLWVEQPQQGLEFARQAARLDPNEFRYVETLALILNKLEQRDEGIQLMEEFQQRHPGNPQAIRTLLDRYLAGRDWEKMVPLKRLAAEADHAGGMAWVELALIFQRLGWIDSTFATLEQAIDQGFIDRPFLDFAFEEDLGALKRDARYKAIVDKMARTRRERADSRKREALGDPLALPAPLLRATALEGYPVQLDDFRGKIVILGFWSTWSGWAKIVEPRLLDFNKQLPNDVQFIGVNVHERAGADVRPELVKRYVEDRGLTWPIWLADEVTASRFGIQALPSYLILDREGVIRHHIIGYTPYVDEVLGWMIDDLRQEVYAQGE